MTLQLRGFSASNYYNKIKLQLMEKAVPFEEVMAWTGRADPSVVRASPLGKLAFLMARVKAQTSVAPAGRPG